METIAAVIVTALITATYYEWKEAMWTRRLTNRHTDLINGLAAANKRICHQRDRLRSRIAYIQLKKTLGV